MNPSAKLVALMLLGFLPWILSVVLPLAMLKGRNHKLLFSLAGCCTTYISLKIGGIIWAFLAGFICAITGVPSLSTSLVLPGLKNGSMALSMLPNLVSGILLSILCLSILKRYDGKNQSPHNHKTDESGQGAQSNLPELMAAFRAESDSRVQAHLVEAIWQQRQQSVIPFLGEAL